MAFRQVLVPLTYFLLRYCYLIFILGFNDQFLIQLFSELAFKKEEDGGKKNKRRSMERLN